jgi:hypothetical protein
MHLTGKAELNMVKQETALKEVSTEALNMEKLFLNWQSGNI